jgi:hypothetical protein
VREEVRIKEKVREIEKLNVLGREGEKAKRKHI